MLALWGMFWIGTDSNDSLAPRLSVCKVLEALRNAIEALVDVIKDGRGDLFSLEHVKQRFPCLANLVGFVLDICAPMDTGHSDVLEQDQVGWNLFDGPSCKADDDDAAIPRNDLERGDDHANGVVNHIDAMPLGDLYDLEAEGRELLVRCAELGRLLAHGGRVLTLDLILPVFVAVVDGIVSASVLLADPKLVR